MRSRSAGTILLVGMALLAMTASRAEAETGQNVVSEDLPHVFFDNYCTMGSLQVCASVRVFTSADGKSLTMQVWNLHSDMGLQHTINTLGLYHMEGAGWTGSVTDLNAFYVTGTGTQDISSYWKVGSAQIGNRASIELELATDSKGNQGIVGCEPLPGGNTKWMTCNSWPNPAYVQFDFTLSQSFSLDELALRWHSLQVNLSDDISLKCDTGLPEGDGDSYQPCYSDKPPPPQVVPEPITMVLLGTGLAGLGVARRRRKNGDVTDA